MKTIENFSLESFIHFLDCSNTDIFDGCTVMQGTMIAGYVSPTFRMDDSFILLCTDGALVANINGYYYPINRNSMFVYPSNEIVQIQSEENSLFFCIISTIDYLTQYHNYWKDVFPLMTFLKNHNKIIIQLSEVEFLKIQSMINSVCYCMKDKAESVWMHGAILSGLNMLLCFIWGKLNSITEYTEQIECSKIHLSRDDEIFAQFMKLLSLYYKQERSVEFYASQLCISPKYMSCMIKKACGKTPCQLIDDVVMEEVYHLLKNSNISIKEIANEMNFANISFFVKYVKRYSGVSPNHYRFCAISNKPIYCD